jgi:hypothetical protein
MLLFVAIYPITSNEHQEIQNREKTPFTTTKEREQKKGNSIISGKPYSCSCIMHITSSAAYSGF